MRGSNGGVLDEGFELAQTGRHALEGKAEATRGRLGLGGKRRIVALRQVDQAGVVAEIVGQEFRVAIEAEALEHQSVELPGEKIGEIEGAGCRLGQGGKALLAGEARIAMRAGEPFDRLFLQHAIERAARAAIGIGHVDAVMRGPGFLDGVANGAGDQSWTIVQRRRQAAEIQMGQAIRLDHGNDLARQRATSDDQRALHGRHLLVGRHSDGARSMITGRRGNGLRQAITRCWLCFLAMKRWAVSTATEASRQ
jgi:hypothetical protein